MNIAIFWPPASLLVTCYCKVLRINNCMKKSNLTLLQIFSLRSNSFMLKAAYIDIISYECVWLAVLVRKSNIAYVLVMKLVPLNRDMKFFCVLHVVRSD